jgi:hypothetical protein
MQNYRPVFKGGLGRHVLGGVVKSQGRQNILAKLILKIMYLMKKNCMFYYVIICLICYLKKVLNDFH